MKTITRFALVLMLVAALSLSALASETITVEGNYNIPISGTYQPSSSDAEVVSVDIAWGSMNFRYAAPSAGTWDPETHGYIGATEGGWSTNKPGITVTNHSNVGIEAAFSFTAADGVTTKGSFYASAGEMTSMTELTAAEQKFSLATAVGTTTDNAPADTLYFGISGDPISENKSLGTITISIAKKTPKRTVGTEEELNAAIEALKTTGGTITLTSDLTLTNPIEIPAGTGTSTAPLIIDFGGKTVEGRIAIVGTETSRSYVTLKNGKLDYLIAPTGRTLRDDPTQAAVYARYTDLKLEDLDVDSFQLTLRTSDGTKTLIAGSGNACSMAGCFDSSASEQTTYHISIYNTSLDDFILSYTGDNAMIITGYIVSNYNITLKQTKGDATYSFEDGVRGNFVLLNTYDGDMSISSASTFQAVGPNAGRRGVILHTSMVLTE